MNLKQQITLLRDFNLVLRISLSLIGSVVVSKETTVNEIFVSTELPLYDCVRH